MAPRLIRWLALETQKSWSFSTRQSYELVYRSLRIECVELSEVTPLILDGLNRIEPRTGRKLPVHLEPALTPGCATADADARICVGQLREPTRRHEQRTMAYVVDHLALRMEAIR